MTGIVAVGAYVPAYRLAREAMAAQTGVRAGGGERAVANYDEDSLTLAAQAASDCLAGIEPAGVQGVFFASTTSPFREKQAAAVLAAALDLPRGVRTVDFGGSLRAAADALQAAAEAVAHGGQYLVTSGETRPAEPESEQEQLFGDAGAAVLLGTENVLAELEGSYTVSDPFTDYWRTGSEAVQAGDARFIEQYGYARLVPEAVQGLLRQQGIAAADVQRLLLPSPDGRQQKKVVGRLGFPEEAVQDTLVRQVGVSGAAMPLLLLAAALETARPGDRLLLAAYGDGCSAFLFRVTENIATLKERRGLGYYLRYRREMGTYGKYLRFKNVTAETSYEPFSSLALLWREERQNLRFYGVRCNACGSVFFPAKRVCERCGKKDDFTPQKLARRGEIYTFTRDHVYLSPDPPLCLAVVDLEGGGRFVGQVTDADPAEVTIGLPVELVFRKLHDGLGVPTYFWKARPRKEV